MTSLPFGDLDVESLAEEATALTRGRLALGPLPDYTPKQDTNGV